MKYAIEAHKYSERQFVIFVSKLEFWVHTTLYFCFV